MKRYTAVLTIFEITINDKYTLLDDAILIVLESETEVLYKATLKVIPTALPYLWWWGFTLLMVMSAKHLFIMFIIENMIKTALLLMLKLFFALRCTLVSVGKDFTGKTE